MLDKKLTPIRAIVVDDSNTAREMLTSLLNQTEDIQVVGTATNGEEAVRVVKRMHPDVVTMDVRMPKMDGLEATRQIMRQAPTPIVIVSGSMKQQDMDLTFQALQAGALTVIHKPGVSDEDTCVKLVQTVRTMAGVPVVHHWGRKAVLKNNPPIMPPQSHEHIGISPEILLSEIDIIGIASSTGGPSALASLFRPLKPGFPLPILVVQHVSPGFTSGLVEWLSTQTNLSVDIATHGDLFQPGHILLAPDDYHLQVRQRGVVELSKAPVYKGLRPSANVLFDSLACVYGPRALGIILTGMGDDGADGIQTLYQAGGKTIAQNAESCIVYGMPSAAVERKAVTKVLSLDQIGILLDQLSRVQRL